MSFLTNITDTHVRGLLAFLVIVSVIIGFFMGVIPLEVFTGIVGAILTYYYQGNQIVKLEKEKDAAVAQALSMQVEIQSLKE